MNSSLAEDPRKNIVVFVNNIPTKYVAALDKLSDRLGRPLRTILLIDPKRRATRKSTLQSPAGVEELVVDFCDDVALSRVLRPLQKNLLLVTCPFESSQSYFKRVIPHVPYINTPTESSIDYCTDKGKMRQLLSAYDERLSPKSVVVYDSTQSSIDMVCNDLKFPLMVKPTNLASSRLVSKVDDEAELRTTIGQGLATLRTINAASHRDARAAMVVEEFIKGDLFSVDAYVDAAGKVYVLPFNQFFNGTAAGADSYQVYQGETYHTLSSEAQRRGKQVAQQAVYAVGLRCSVAHIELFHDQGQWKIVELGARPGGWRQEMYQLSYGIDHALNELLIKIGLEPEMPTAINAYVTTFSVHAPKAGTFNSISGVEEVREHPCLHTLYIKPSIGESVVPSTQGGGAIVDGLMVHKDIRQLRQAVEFARASIRIHII